MHGVWRCHETVDGVFEASCEVGVKVKEIAAKWKTKRDVEVYFVSYREVLDGGSEGAIDGNALVVCAYSFVRDSWAGQKILMITRRGRRGRGSGKM